MPADRIFRYKSAMLRFAVLFFVTALSWSSVWASPGQPWPQEGSDLTPDLRITFGRLENGVRLAIFPNNNPQGRISLRLLVAAGSLNENEAERGLAHFVEHMAFNGTTHFPSGKLVEFLQRQGMGFGADVNAFTSPSSTIYKLELSDHSPESLHEALRIFRDYADGILFDPAAVERERGIILAEARVRDTGAYRREIYQDKALYADSLLPNRHPIGLTEIIQKATPAALKAFYQAWYRPERMTLIISGDMADPNLQPEIQRVFGDLKSSASARPDFILSAIKPDESDSVHIHQDPSELGVSLGLENVRNVGPQPFSRQVIQHSLSLEVAYSILRERTQRLLARKDSPEGGFGIGTETVEQVYQRSYFDCGTSANQWKPALRDLTVELRRACAQGFTADEMARQRINFESYLKEAVANQNSRTSSTLADLLAENLSSHRVTLSPESQLAIVSAGFRDLTPEICQAALNEAWENGRKIILVSANDNFSATPAEIAEVHEQGQKISLGAPTDHPAAHFGYTDFGPVGEVTSKTHRPTDDTWEVTFRNGVRLHFKQTTFEPNSVQVALRFGTGRLNEPGDKPGLGMLAIGQLYGGLGLHTFDELGLILTGTHGSVVFKVGSDGFLFSSTSTPDNALIFTQLLTAFMIDPALREESRAHTFATIASTYQQRWDGPQGVIDEMIHPQLAGGDSRIGLPRRAVLDAYSLAAYKEWFLPQIKFAPMDMTIIGDLSIDAAVQLVAQTTGALPPLQPPPDLEKNRMLSFPLKPFDFTWTVEDTKSQSGFIELYWPLKKPISGTDQLRLTLLMDILSDRLRVFIRQAMGKTYSPSAGIELFRDFNDYGWLTCQIEASPKEILRVQKAALEQVAKLVKTGANADELQRAQQVRLATRERERQTNSYWLTALDESSRYPALLEWHTHGPEIISAVSLVEINRLAREYLRADQISIFRIVPKQDAKK